MTDAERILTRLRQGRREIQPTMQEDSRLAARFLVADAVGVGSLGMTGNPAGNQDEVAHALRFTVRCTWMPYYTYIMTNHSRTLYTGMTNDLERRVAEHREGQGSTFTRKYGINQVVYFEQYARVEDAIDREKEIKRWRREKKVKLIESSNPHWEDLAADR